MNPIKGLFLINAGSHVETIECIINALEKIPENTITDYLLIDFVGWRAWDATRIPYTGSGIRRQLQPSDWNVDSSKLLNKDIHYLVYAAEEFLAREEINLLVAMTDTEYPNWAFFQAAKKRSLPSLLIQEGPRPRKIVNVFKFSENKEKEFHLVKTIISKYSTLLTSYRQGSLGKKLAERISRENRELLALTYGDGGASAMAVPSDYYVEYYRAALKNCPLLKVTGIPRFDNLLESREKFIERQGKEKSSAENKRILIISQPFWRYGELTQEKHFENYRSIFVGLNNIVQELSIEVVLRLHPSDQMQDICPFFENLRLQVTVQSSENPIYKVLPDFDLVIGCTSTVLIEALIVGIPVISWQRNMPSPGSFISNLNILAVYDIEQLIQGVKEIFSTKQNNTSESALVDEIGHLDGAASEKVARLCLNLLKDNVLYNNRNA